MTLDDQICSECSIERDEELKSPTITSITMKKRDTSSLNNPTVISKISEQKYKNMHDSLYNLITCMCNNESVPITCQSFEECDIYLDYHFSHLEEQDDNIFDPNKTQNDINPLDYL